MANIGDEVHGSMVELARRMLDIIILLLKWIIEHTKGRLEMPIKFGKIGWFTMHRLKETGDKPRTVQVPRDKLDMLNKAAKQLGAQYFVMKDFGDSKTVTLAVPESSFTQMNDAIAAVTQKMLTDDKESLNIHGREEAVQPQDKGAVNEALAYYDVPVFKYDRPDGSQVNIVPKAAEEDYSRAMKIAEKVTDRMKNDIVIEKYTPTVEIEKADHIVREVEPLEAANLAADFGKDIEIMTDGERYAVKYPDTLEEKINTAFGDVDRQVRGIQTAASDNSLSINKGNIEREDENAYLVRIPGTQGQDHMWIDKELVNNSQSTDKTIVTQPFLDPGRQYAVCDKNGQEKRNVSGAEMLGYWNSGNILGNKSTQTSEHGTTDKGRIEIYDPVKNRLYRIEPNAEIAKNTLIGSGYSALAADRILADAAKKMTSEMKVKFGFEKFDIRSSSAVRKTDEQTLTNAVKESNIAQVVKDADYAGKQQTFSKEECICIYEKTSKKYTIINADTTSDDLKNALKDMGCTDIEQNVIHENLIEKLELNELKKEIVPNYFVSDMAELRGISYKFDDQCKAAVFLRPTEDGGFSFAIIGADRTREELEKLLTDKKNFGLSDKAAAKIIHECCFGQDPELQRIIAEKDRPESKHISNTPLTIIPLTSKSAMISDGKKEIITETEKINSEFLIKAFAVNPKLAENAAKAIAKGFKREERADGRKTFAEVLGNITKREKQKKTERAVERTNTLMDEKGKASETVSLSKSIVR